MIKDIFVIRYFLIKNLKYYYTSTRCLSVFCRIPVRRQFISVLPLSNLTTVYLVLIPQIIFVLLLLCIWDHFQLSCDLQNPSKSTDSAVSRLYNKVQYSEQTHIYILHTANWRFYYQTLTIMYCANTVVCCDEYKPL